MYTEIPAADLPDIEPDADDLHALAALSWDETQTRMERLLAEAGLIEQARAAAEDTDAEVRRLPVAGTGGDLGVAA